MQAGVFRLSDLAGFSAAVLCAVALHAQETRGTISGVITDAAGRRRRRRQRRGHEHGNEQFLPAGNQRTGYYEARLLLPGSYRVSAESQGFRRTLRSGVTLAASQEAEINVQLEIGTLTETVAVTAEAPLLDTSAVSAGRSIDRRSMVDLPAMSSNPVLFVKTDSGCPDHRQRSLMSRRASPEGLPITGTRKAWEETSGRLMESPTMAAPAISRRRPTSTCSRRCASRRRTSTPPSDTAPASASR